MNVKREEFVKEAIETTNDIIFMQDIGDQRILILRSIVRAYDEGFSDGSKENIIKPKSEYFKHQGELNENH